MKKQIGWILTILILIFGASFPLQLVAQTTAKSAKTVWYVDFTVTMKGKGQKVAESEGESDIFWSIDRTYYSNLELVGSNPTLNEFHSQDSKAKPASVHITIADRLLTFNKGPGEIGTHQDTTVETHWDGDFTEIGRGLNARLEVNNQRATYNVWIPFVPSSTKLKNIKMTKQTTLDRSAVGYGGKPTREELPIEETLVGNNSLGVPTLDEILGHQMGVIRHWREMPLPLNFNTSWTFDSGELEPDEPFIKGVPDSKTNLKVRVIYRFSRTPLF